MSSADRYDIAILGAGFGASLLAAILSKHGMHVCLINQGSHPRFAVGESSTPAADFILGRLCETYKLNELAPLTQFGLWRDAYPDIRCGCKSGFSYFWHGSGDEYKPTDAHENELLVAASASRDVADTQWYRADVDQFVCKYSVMCGADYFDNTQIGSISHIGDYDWKLSLRRQTEDCELRADFLIDATGPAAILLNHLEIEDDTDCLRTNTSAIYSHFENVLQMSEWLQDYATDQKDFPYPVDDSAIHHVFNDGWLWQLRFEDGLCSLGYVFNKATSSTHSHVDDWESLLADKPILREITKATRLAKSPGQIIKSNRLQRLKQRAAGADWAALPFTAGFIDPLHSTGIAHTLLGVERLAQLLISRNSSKMTLKLEEYSTKIIRELRHIDRLVSLCYEGINSFPRWSAACMLYFAAATSFEKNYSSGHDDFLLADDLHFRTLLEEVSTLLKSSPAVFSESQSDPVLSAVREGIQPFNHVGLFSPQIPNMYFHTAAAK